MGGATTYAQITTSLVNEESDIVNTGGTVVSAVHFQGAGTTDPDPLVLNGISHTLGSGSDTNLTINTSFEGDFRNGETGFPQDGSNIIQVLYSGIAGAGAITMSVSGLTVGKEYLFQAYWEANNLGAVLEATIEGETQGGLVALADKVTNPWGTVIFYRFVAGDDTLNASFNRTDSVTNDWLSGYSLQEIPESFSNWIADFPTVGGQTGFTDDPDGDRLANGLEAWFGTHPGVLNAGLANLTFDGTTTITFSHPQNLDPPRDVTGFYQWSLNLIDWYAGDGIDGPTDDPTATISPVTVGTTTNVTVITSEVLTTLFLRAGATQN